MHEVLVNRLGGLSLPRKSVVRLTDRPDMTLDVYRGRKTTMQQQQQQPRLVFTINYLNSFYLITYTEKIGPKRPGAKGKSRNDLLPTLTTFPFFTFALAGCLQSFHPTHAQLSNRNGKFVFSGTFHIMWVKVGQGILPNRSIFLNKSDQLCINMT